MTIFDKVIEIFQKYYICPHCLGRTFALLGTSTTNLDRGNSLLLSNTMENHKKYLSQKNVKEQHAINNLMILAENANFLPAQKVLKNEGFHFSKKDHKCFLCNDIFQNLEKYVEKVKEITKNIEFNNFLIGTRPDSKIVNREDIFKAELNLLDSESFKNHFNREIGKIISLELKKPHDFDNPDINFIFGLGYEEFNIELIIRSVFISGRYNKLIRGIPQTHWTCKGCQGKGCESCNFSGKMYEISVEGLISPEFVKEFQATSSKFHGAGREDIDVRMLGTGRPFILELKNPKIRKLDLNKIMKRVNKIQKKKVMIRNLEYSNKKKVIKIKAESENIRKVYKALVGAEIDFKLDNFNDKLEELRNKLENQIISQRTPNRVSHRRADLIRKKTIYKIEGQHLKPNLYEFTIETQGGTYIKELISGDNGRTIPSFSEIFETPLLCKELDVIEIKK